MELLLRVIEGPSDSEWRGLEARFDASGGLIGRAETARLSLPDSTRTVSRFHAHVSYADGMFCLEEMGSRNAATINGRALGVGEKAPLRPGDQVRVGHFTLAVEFDDPDFPKTREVEKRRAPVPDPGGPALDEPTRIVSRGVPLRGGGSSGPSAIWEAFLDGAGVTLNLPHTDRPELMRSVGLMLRSLVGGVHRLANQRMRLRDEAGPDRARPQARQLDAVRQAADESRLIAALLEQSTSGSGPPLARIHEMLEDLAAQVAAMRTAVNVAVEQAEAKLAPSAVEERLESSLFLDELLPMRRKARLWDLYRRTHGAAGGDRTERGDGKVDGSAEARTDGKSAGKQASRSTAAKLGVREAFNRAFSRAYEAEVARLRKDRA
jgi:predicted component of type VI protein secretion system